LHDAGTDSAGGHPFRVPQPKMAAAHLQIAAKKMNASIKVMNEIATSLDKKLDIRFV
jgi:hypothetical protein